MMVCDDSQNVFIAVPALLQSMPWEMLKSVSSDDPIRRWFSISTGTDHPRPRRNIERAPLTEARSCNRSNGEAAPAHESGPNLDHSPSFAPRIRMPVVTEDTIFQVRDLFESFGQSSGSLLPDR
jgi:hypothetical protein